MSNVHTGSNFSTDLVAGNMKLAMKDADAKSRDLWMVPVENLVILDDFNVRSKNDEYHTAVREIADSIKENGFYSHKPFAVLVIKRNGHDVIAVYDGHTRYDGVQLAISEGALIERVPAIAAPSGTTVEDITVGLVTNNSGRQLEPMGIAVVCKRLVGYGYTNTEISKRLGFTSAYVGGLLSLVGAPKRIRDMVSNGKVSATLAVNTLRDEGESAVNVLEAGLNIAKADGKSKVTKKNLVSVNKPTSSGSAIEKGLLWINNNGQMDSSYELLSAITGKSVSQLKKIKV